MTSSQLTKIMDKYSDVIKLGLQIRRVEEKLLELFDEGELNGTIHTCIGQELVGPFLMKSLTEDDFITSNHRCHGHYIARTSDLRGLISELMGRKSGVCGGLGGSQHLWHHNFMSNGIQGGMVPVAAGAAFSFKLQGVNNIAVAFIGDGTLGEGIIYETFNLCGVWELPLLIVVENNGYAQSTCTEQVFSGSLKTRAAGFGLEYAKATTWDLDCLSEVTASAVMAVRTNRKPCVLEIETYRLRAHSKGDDNRNVEEVLANTRMDVLTQFIGSGIPEISELLAIIDSQINEIVHSSRADEPATAVPLFEGRLLNDVEYLNILPESENIKLNELIYGCLKERFSEDGRYVMIGEDIEHVTPWTPCAYGGAFKVSRDLSKLFGGRVTNTPISEAAIVGIGAGLALTGMRPIVEIMFGDFITLAYDQILNHATKFCSMYGKPVDVPLIIRTPMGGRRGYGPTHSQSLEKYLLGIPDLIVIALNSRIAPAVIYGACFENKRPTLVIENKVMYTRNLKSSPIHGFSIEKSNEQYPTLRITPHSDTRPEVTVFCYGGTLEEVEKAVQLAFDEYEICCEVICPSAISPMNYWPVIDSVVKSRNLLVVEEGSTIAALNSELAAVILEQGISMHKFARIGCDATIASSAEIERIQLPGARMILAKLREMMNE